MWWHAGAYRLMGLSPSVDPGMAASLAELERRSGLAVPAAVREWYSVPGAADWLARRRGNLFTAGPDLGVPLRGIDYLAGGLLALETDSQYCWRWVVPLVAPPPGPPLFPVAAATGNEREDPPVFLVDPEDGDAETTRERYADRFSTYVLTSVWDLAMLSGAVVNFDHPLPPPALGTFRQRYTELPATYAWDGSQSCDAVYRFDGTAQLAIAVSGEKANYSAVAAGTRQHRAELLATLGL